MSARALCISLSAHVAATCRTGLLGNRIAVRPALCRIRFVKEMGTGKKAGPRRSRALPGGGWVVVAGGVGRGVPAAIIHRDLITLRLRGEKRPRSGPLVSACSPGKTEADSMARGELPGGEDANGRRRAHTSILERGQGPQTPDEVCRHGTSAGRRSRLCSDSTMNRVCLRRSVWRERA